MTFLSPGARTKTVATGGLNVNFYSDVSDLFLVIVVTSFLRKDNLTSSSFQHLSVKREREFSENFFDFCLIVHPSKQPPFRPDADILSPLFMADLSEVWRI